MKKTAILVVSYFLYLAIAVIVVSVMPFSFVASENDPWSYLADFDQRLREYQRSPETPHNVIVGPSYAVHLGSFPNTYNLALGAANHKECAYIIKHYVRPQDKVYYVLTLREAVFLDKPFKLWMVITPLRRAVIAKMMLHGFGPQQDFTVSGTNENSVTDEEALRISLGLAELPSYKNELARRIKIFSTRQTILNNPSESISSRVTFIIHPSVPLKHVPETSEFARQINRLARTRENFAQCLPSSSTIDFTNSCDPALFRDFFHLNDDGVLKFRKTFEQEVLSHGLDAPDSY